MKKIMAIIICMIVGITFAACSSKISFEAERGSDVTTISQKENFIISFFKDQFTKNKSTGKKYNILTLFMLVITLFAAFFGIFTVMDEDAQVVERAKQKQEEEKSMRDYKE